MIQDGYSLPDSYVLSVFENADRFGVLVLGALLGGQPRRGEAFQYAVILLTGRATRIVWAARDLSPSVDPDGSVDFGFVEEISEYESSFYFHGERIEFRAHLTSHMEYLVLD